MDERNMLFYVVEFPQEETDGSCPMSVISEKWTFSDDGILYCWWPNYKTDKSRENAVKNHLQVGPENGSMCEIRIKYKTENYDKARKKLKLLEVSSDIETDDDPSRRKSLQSQKFKDYVMSESDDSGDSLPNIPSLHTGQSKQPIPPLQHDDDLVSIVESKEYETHTQNRMSKVATCGKCANLNEEMLLKIYRSVEKYNTEINERLNYITSLLQQTNITSSIENTSCDMLPLKTLDQLKQLDNQLAEGDEYKKYLNILKLVGGKDCPETTRRIMAKLIGHELALISNWTGRNDKPPFSSFKNVIKLVTEAVMANPLSKPTFTTSCVESTIKVWLRGACDREGGRNIRKNK